MIKTHLFDKNLYKQHGYLKGVYLALKITIISLFKNIFALEKRMTLNYPEEKYQYSDRFKGMHVLTVKDDGSLRCTSCMLCSTYCPADCIHIIAAENENPEVEKSPVSFEIELLRCVFCGFCEEACPVDAIRLTKEYELADFSNKDWLVGIPELAFRPSLNGGKGILSRVDDKDRKKLRL